MNKKFDYGDYIIEYRLSQFGPLCFSKKKTVDVDNALKEASRLKDLGHYDVKIRKIK